jgi:hypothetical protein
VRGFAFRQPPKIWMAPCSSARLRRMLPALAEYEVIPLSTEGRLSSTLARERADYQMRREYRDTRDEKPQALSSELWRARHTIVNLVPPAITGVLQGYYRYDTLEQRDAWHSETVDKLIDTAVRQRHQRRQLRHLHLSLQAR